MIILYEFDLFAHLKCLETTASPVLTNLANFGQDSTVFFLSKLLNALVKATYRITAILDKRQ